MAIQYIGRYYAPSTAANGVSTSTKTISASGLYSGSPYLPGDFCLVVSGLAALSQITPGVTSPAVNQISSLYSNDSYDINVETAWFWITTSGSFDVTFRVNPNNLYSASILLMMFRGVDTVTPLDVTSASWTGVNSQYVNPPAITPVSDNCVIVPTGMVTDNSIGSVSTYPSGYTGTSGSSWSADQAATMITSAYRILSGGAGVSQDPGQFVTSFTQLTASWASTTVALRPATGRTKYWNGSSWLAKPVKYWNGSSWVTKPVKYWNGSSWVKTNW